MTTTEEQFLNDIKTQLYQYIYRSTEAPANSLFLFLENASGNGALNWHLPENKTQMAKIFTDLAAAIQDYSLDNGDFRFYLLQVLVASTYNTYNQPLFTQYLRQGYNVAPETVEGSLSNAYSTQPPQNTNFPGIDNTASEFIPESTENRLVPTSLYSNDQ